MNIGMIRIYRPPFLADDALLYFLGHATSSSALRERPLFLAGADPRPTSEKYQYLPFSLDGNRTDLRSGTPYSPVMHCCTF